MVRYIITCDIPADSERYDKVLQALAKCGSFTRITDATWLVATRLSARELFLRLRLHSHAQDTLYLLRFEQALEGFGPRRINQWIELTETQLHAANG